MFTPNIPAIEKLVEDVLKTAEVPHVWTPEFVEASLEAKARFFHLPFDEMGRFEVDFKSTKDTILIDNPWLKILLEELGINIDYLNVIQDRIWVTDGNKGLLLSKVLAKHKDRIFGVHRNWMQWHPQYSCYFCKNDRWIDRVTSTYVTLTPEQVLCEIGDITCLTRKLVISINPADYLRSSLQGKYCAYSTCHNLNRGSYRYGCINYAMDSAHIMSYVTDCASPVQKIIGRSMVVVRDDFAAIGQRRFYPSLAQYGDRQAKAVREQLHNMFNPDCKSVATTNFTVNGNTSSYLDDVVVYTANQEIDPQATQTTLSEDVFCFKCGKIYQEKQLYCNSRTCDQDYLDKLEPSRVEARKARLQVQSRTIEVADGLTLEAPDSLFEQLINRRGVAA